MFREAVASGTPESRCRGVRQGPSALARLAGGPAQCSTGLPSKYETALDQGLVLGVGAQDDFAAVVQG